MLLLRLDVAADFRRPGLTYGNGEVSNLPFESTLDLSMLVDPAGGIGLDEAHRRGDREIRLELHQQVDVVRHAPDLQ